MKYLAVTSTKGGVGKTTTAIHAAYWFAEKGYPTVLIDGDSNRTGLKWEARSKSNERFDAPFKVSSLAKMAKAVQGAQIVIIDTAASVADDELKDLAEDCDLIIIPTKTDIDSATAAAETAKKTQDYKGTYRILITDSPTVSKAGAELRSDLSAEGHGVFDVQIRRGEGVRHASLAGATLAQQTGNYRLPWSDYQAVFQVVAELLELEN